MSEDNQWPERLWRDLDQAERQHLSYEQLEGYVDSRLESTEAELVRAHTEICPRCAAELNDLTAFAVKLKAPAQSRPAPASVWERLAAWVRIPRNVFAVAGAFALLAIVVALPRSQRPPIEAVLESPDSPAGESLVASKPYRVLTPEERGEYRKELSAAPDDPVIRASIAIKFSLFGEAAKEYRRLEMKGGADAARARQLLQDLDRLRGQ